MLSLNTALCIRLQSWYHCCVSPSRWQLHPVWCGLHCSVMPWSLWSANKIIFIALCCERLQESLKKYDAVQLCQWEQGTYRWTSLITAAGNLHPAALLLSCCTDQYYTNKSSLTTWHQKFTKLYHYPSSDGSPSPGIHLYSAGVWNTSTFNCAAPWTVHSALEIWTAYHP